MSLSSCFSSEGCPSRPSSRPPQPVLPPHKAILATAVPNSLTDAMEAVGQLAFLVSGDDMQRGAKDEAAAHLKRLVMAVAQFAHDHHIHLEGCVRARQRELYQLHPVPIASTRYSPSLVERHAGLNGFRLDDEQVYDTARNLSASGSLQNTFYESSRPTPEQPGAGIPRRHSSSSSRQGQWPSSTASPSYSKLGLLPALSAASATTTSGWEARSGEEEPAARSVALSAATPTTDDEVRESRQRKRKGTLGPLGPPLPAGAALDTNVDSQQQSTTFPAPAPAAAAAGAPPADSSASGEKSAVESAVSEPHRWWGLWILGEAKMR